MSQRESMDGLNAMATNAVFDKAPPLALNVATRSHPLPVI